MTTPITRSELEAQRFEEWRQAYIAAAAARGIRIPRPDEPDPEPVGADHDFEDD